MDDIFYVGGRRKFGSNHLLGRKPCLCVSEENQIDPDHLEKGKGYS
jgi:hypothetical protein